MSCPCRGVGRVGEGFASGSVFSLRPGELWHRYVARSQGLWSQCCELLDRVFREFAFREFAFREFAFWEFAFRDVPSGGA